MRPYVGALLVVTAVGLSIMLCETSFAEPEKPAAKVQTGISYKLGREAQIGLTAIDRGRHIPLTYSPSGETSSTVLQINGADAVFGSNEGDWNLAPTALGKSKDGRQRNGHWCNWVIGSIKVTQVVEIVPSHTGQTDTCLIFYVLENGDKRAHDVGLRTMIDTQIADNDGNSFGLGGRAITTSADFKTAREIPTVIEVRQTSDPKRPGFVAQLSVKIGGGFEPPDRCSLTQWPGPSRIWDVPMQNIDGDAAVALYWNPRRLEAGGRRLIGYAYGLGVINLPPAGK